MDEEECKTCQEEHRRSCELEQVWNDDELKVVEDIL